MADDAEILLVGYGIVSRVLRTAVEQARAVADGKDVLLAGGVGGAKLAHGLGEIAGNGIAKSLLPGRPDADADRSHRRLRQRGLPLPAADDGLARPLRPHEHSGGPVHHVARRPAALDRLAQRARNHRRDDRGQRG